MFCKSFTIIVKYTLFLHVFFYISANNESTARRQKRNFNYLEEFCTDGLDNVSQELVTQLWELVGKSKESIIVLSVIKMLLCWE